MGNICAPVLSNPNRIARIIIELVKNNPRTEVKQRKNANDKDFVGENLSVINPIGKRVRKPIINPILYIKAQLLMTSYSE